MGLLARDETKPGVRTLRAGVAAYIAAFALSLAVNPRAAGALIMLPLIIPLVALVISVFIFATSMVWGFAPIDFAYAKLVLKRNYRMAWGVILLLSALAAFIGAIARQN